MHWDPGPFFNWDRLMRLAGAKKTPARALPEVGDAVVIKPDYATNEPTVSHCNPGDPHCADLPAQPANFVPLYTSWKPGSSLISDPFLSGKAQEPNGVGTTQADDWGSKAVSGQTFIVAGVKGDWTAVWYGSQKAWFLNPDGENTAPTSARFVKVAQGKDPIPVWGAAYPSKLQKLSLGYSIPRGQKYTVNGPVQTDRYQAELFDDLANYFVLSDDTVYYEIQYNHRHGFVQAKDVVVQKTG
jgi:hypothetical protein